MPEREDFERLKKLKEAGKDNDPFQYGGFDFDAEIANRDFNPFEQDTIEEPELISDQDNKSNNQISNNVINNKPLKSRQFEVDQDWMGNGLRYEKRKRKLDYIESERKDSLLDLIKGRISKDTTLHIISNKNFDGFTFIPVLIQLYGSFDYFYGSTWTINQYKTEQLNKLLTEGKIK